MEEQNLIKALEAYIEKKQYKNEYGDPLPAPDQFRTVRQAFELLYDLKF